MQDNLPSQADSCRVDTCKFCKHDFVDEDSALIICEYYDACICVPCANVSPSEYDILQSSTHLHWFCDECKNPAMSVVKKDHLIKKKCSALLQIFRQNYSVRVEV